MTVAAPGGVAITHKFRGGEKGQGPSVFQPGPMVVGTLPWLASVLIVKSLFAS